MCRTPRCTRSDTVLFTRARAWPGAGPCGNKHTKPTGHQDLSRKLILKKPNAVLMNRQQN